MPSVDVEAEGLVFPKSQNDRMACVGRDFKDNAPAMELLDQVAQGSIQLKQVQGWSIHNFSGLLVPGPHHPQSKEFPPDFQSTPLFPCVSPSSCHRLLLYIISLHLSCGLPSGTGRYI